MADPTVAPIEFKVLVEPSLPTIVPDAISFETGGTVEQTLDATLYAYEHHGEGFSLRGVGALTTFFEDLIMGRQLPLTFATRAIRDVDVLFAIALFLHRDLAIHPSTPGVIASVDLAHRHGLPFLGHLDRGLERFLTFLRAYFPAGLSRREAGDRLSTALGWIYAYISEGTLPHLGSESPPARIIDVGTNGFVLGQVNRPEHLQDGWVGLFRRGFLRGVIVSQEKGGRRHVLAARKSRLVDFDLVKGAMLLNEVETAMGELPEWSHGDTWLHGPPEGSLVLITHMMEVFLRL